MEPWGRVAKAVKDRRLNRGWTQQEASERAGVSLATWRLLEASGRDRYQDLTVRGVSRALGWAPDTFEAILAGAEPPADDHPQEPAPSPTEPDPRAGSQAGPQGTAGSVPSGFARKYLELTSEEQAMVEGYVEGLAARHRR